MKSRKISPVFKIQRIPFVLALAAVAALASGCGQQAYTEQGTGTTTGNTGGGTVTTAGGTTSGGTVTTPGGTVTTTTTTTNSPPNYQYHFAANGASAGYQIGGGAMSAATDTVLRISVTAGDGMPLSGTGYSVGFNCEQFTIKVGNVTQTAFVKKANYTDFMLQYGYMSYDPCQSAQATWTGDFSGALGPGHQTVNISVLGNSKYDNCRLASDPYDGGCGLSVVYSTHSIDGYLQVFTD